MFKRKLAVTLTAVLLSAAGAAQAATSTFPSAAEEGSGVSINTPLPAAVSGHSGALSGFPSAASEGGETSGQTATYSGTHNLERSYARGPGDVFPSTAVE